MTHGNENVLQKRFDLISKSSLALSSSCVIEMELKLDLCVIEIELKFEPLTSGAQIELELNKIHQAQACIKFHESSLNFLKLGLAPFNYTPGERPHLCWLKFR